MHGDGWGNTSIGMGCLCVFPFPLAYLLGVRGRTVPCHCWLPQTSQLTSDLLPPVLVSISANTWPQPPLALTGFLADPLSTPAPANALFGDECRCWQITLCTSPPVTLAQEVLTLGAIMGEADRVVSTAEEVMVTMGILPPATTRDE